MRCAIVISNDFLWIQNQTKLIHGHHRFHSRFCWFCVFKLTPDRQSNVDYFMDRNHLSIICLSGFFILIFHWLWLTLCAVNLFVLSAFRDHCSKLPILTSVHTQKPHLLFGVGFCVRLLFIQLKLRLFVFVCFFCVIEVHLYWAFFPLLRCWNWKKKHTDPIERDQREMPYYYLFEEIDEHLRSLIKHNYKENSL